MQNYVTSLKTIIDNSKITNPRHPYVKLLGDLQAIVKSTNYNNTQSQLEALNTVLIAILFRREYKGLFVLLTTDAGIDSNFEAFYEEFIKNGVEKAKHNIIPHEILFPKDYLPDSEKVIIMVKELIKYFPEEEQKSMWHNFERFGVPLIKEK